MQLIESFQQRFSFSPPDAFGKLGGNESETVWPKLPGFRWFTAAEVNTFTFQDHQWDDFVPFGRNTLGDLWCWWPGQAKDGRVPIVVCPVDCEEGEVYAPDFSSGVFRLVCDTLREMSQHSDGVSGARSLAADCAKLGVHLWPTVWLEFLEAVATKPVTKWNHRGDICSGLLSEEAHQQLLHQWIDDGSIGTVFRWMTTP